MSTSHAERFAAGVMALAAVVSLCALTILLLYKPLVVLFVIALLACCYVVGSVILLRSKIKRNI